MTQLDAFKNIDGVDPTEAPQGYYAVEKVYKGYNICRDCDARPLCQANEGDWCLKNRCMGYEIIAFKDGKTYARRDRKNVLFKRLEK